MRLDEQNRVLIAYSEVVPDVLNKNTYNSLRLRNKIQTTINRACRGRSSEIIYDTLPERYKRKITDTIGNPYDILGIKNPENAIIKSDKKQAIPFSQLTPKEMQICNARYNLVKCYREYAEVNKAIGITKAKREFTELVVSGVMCSDSSAVVGSVSFQTLERWNKELREGGDIMDVLAPERRGKTGSTLLPEHKRRLIDIYLLPNKHTIATCYRFASRMWKMEELPIPSEATCRRFMESWTKENYAVTLYRRNGYKELKDKQLPYIERDEDSIRFMDVLVADGRRMDSQIINPETGKLCRPTLVAWQDMKTGMFVGFEYMITENTMSVASAFRSACMNVGKMCNYEGAVLPRSVYMDNGRAFKNKFFNEKTDLEKQVGGLFERLKSCGLEHVQYAKPYNASSKVIERSFVCFSELDKMIFTYVGNKISNKPARMLRNEIFHKSEYEKAASKNGYPTLWGVYKFTEWWLTDYNNRIGKGKYLAGHSPLELAAKHIEEIDFSSRLLKGNSLDYMMMNTKTMKRKRNGFKINGTSYYNLQFAQVAISDVEYIVKFDILDNTRILVFHEDGTFWCEATPWIGQKIHAMAALGSDADRKKRNDALKVQRSIEKSIMSLDVTTSVDRLYLESRQAPQLTEGAPLPLLSHEEDIYTDLKLW